MRLLSAEEYLQTLKHVNGNPLFIVGAGKYGEILGQYLNRYGIRWDGYIDKRGDLQQINGKSVHTYDGMHDNESYYVISTFQYQASIEQELKTRGVREEKIISYENQDVFYALYDDLIHWRNLSDKIQYFCGKYVGERCFIIGNGPSLRIEDLDQLKREYTFASNSIYALYNRTDWRPHFYCAWDPAFCKEMMSDKEDMKMVLDGCRAAFTSILGEGIQYREDPDMSQLYYMKSMSKTSENGLPLFSADCSKQVYSAGTVTYAMLQLAAYMGFKQIYLLGMDFSYSVEKYKDNRIVKKDVSNHMSEIEEEEKRFYQAVSAHYNETYIAEIDLQLAGYQSAKKYADTHGIKIYNATRGGKLEVFPRIDFDSLFN